MPKENAQPPVTMADMMRPPVGVSVSHDHFAQHGVIKPAFETPRMFVFHFRVGKSEDASRHLFVAFKEDSPRGALVAATMVVWLLPMEKGLLMPSCEWIEVSTEFRRAGLATELYDGVERYTGWTIDTMGTFEAFERAILRARSLRSNAPTKPPAEEP